jgi:hypothetical protein
MPAAQIERTADDDAVVAVEAREDRTPAESRSTS